MEGLEIWKLYSHDSKIFFGPDAYWTQKLFPGGGQTKSESVACDKQGIGSHKVWGYVVSPTLSDQAFYFSKIGKKVWKLAPHKVRTFSSTFLSDYSQSSFVSSGAWLAPPTPVVNGCSSPSLFMIQKHRAHFISSHALWISQLPVSARNALPFSLENTQSQR